MKIQYLSIILILLLAVILFPFNTILAQNQTQPTIRFDQASYFTKDMSCDFYNTVKTSAPDQSKATIIVTDSNANKFSTSIDRITVFVWS
ncbi:MAG: hypothetical protein KGI05_09635, partial [Thaumarchaeota archaeon]|nr:hypothetical protein [Nitrososphaerota archaeon]